MSNPIKTPLGGEAAVRPAPSHLRSDYPGSAMLILSMQDPGDIRFVSLLLSRENRLRLAEQLLDDLAPAAEPCEFFWRLYTPNGPEDRYCLKGKLHTGGHLITDSDGRICSVPRREAAQ